MDSTSEKLPSHLEPLLQPTPSSVAKLLAAWDGLLVETQIDILTRLPNSRLPRYLEDKVRAKALKSQTPYVRYLAYRGAYLSRDRLADMAAKGRLELDPDPLVRYSTKETELGSLNDELRNPEYFLALPHEARLAMVRRLRGGGQHMAKIVSVALDNHLKDGRVSEHELGEVLADYLRKPSFRQYFEGDKWQSGWTESSIREDLEALWRLVPKCPVSLDHLLIESLPLGAGFSEAIPEDVMNALTDSQLEILLYRSDVGLLNLRQKLFKTSGKERERVKSAAMSCNFSIENADLAEILAQPEKEKIEALRNLAIGARDLRLCVYEALHDYLWDYFRTTGAWGADEDAGFAEISKERKLAELEPGRRRDDELRQLRLYHLAREAVPVRKGGYSYTPQGELVFLAEHVVEGDTWATFVAFDIKWRSIPTARNLEKFLPRLDRIDPEIEEEEEEEEEDAGVSDQLSVEEQMSGMRSALELMVGALDKGQTTLGEKIEELSDRLSALSPVREISSMEDSKAAPLMTGWVRVPAWFWQALFLIIPAGIAAQGWLISLAWGWFFSPMLGTRQITLVEGVGIALLFSALTVSTPLRPLKREVGAPALDDKVASELLWQLAIHRVIWPLFLIFLGWLWHTYGRQT